MKLNIIMIEGFYRPNRTFAWPQEKYIQYSRLIGKKLGRGTTGRLQKPTKNELYVEDKMDYIVDE